MRELREEIGATVTSLGFAGTLENIFEYGGEPGHELVMLYHVELAEDERHGSERFDGIEANGEPLRCVWKRIEDFADGGPPLYPDGLLELLSAASRS